ncbi:MAG: gliding motility-associated C-terminal domain-containing protein [Saprospiraceae bacterium]|nr:gliding motility-associated C-terminal domain-containing protein [Saprospiraceae bacterium]
MKNRLRMHWRVVLGFCLFYSWISLSGAFAQQGFFNFNYPGPNSIPVLASSCSNILAGNIGTPNVSSTAGGIITLSAFDPDSSGFLLNSAWNFDEVAHLYWKVQDNQGHTAYFEFFVSFTDTTKPVVNPGGLLPAVSYASIRQVPPPPALTANDSCHTTLTVTFSQTTPPALCAAGTFVRTWLATDQSGNTGIFSQTITILQDLSPPTVLSAPQNGTGACTQLATAYPLWLSTQLGNFVASDPSGVAGYSHNGPGVITGSCPAPLTVTFQATDSCGFAVTRTATFTVTDPDGPLVVLAPRDSVAACSPPANNQLAALADWIHRRARLVAHDGCTPDAELNYSMRISDIPVDSAQVVAAFTNSFANGCSTQQIGSQTYNQVHGKVSVSFYATDACGNTSLMGNAVFAAIDTVAPTLTGTEQIEECGGSSDSTALVSWINNHGNALVSDDCSAYTWTNFSWTTSSGQTGNGLFNAGPYPAIPAHNCNWHVDVRFRATDDCGNTGSTVIRFRIRDTTKPVFSGLAPTVNLYCPNTTPPLPTANVSDNCDNAVSISSNFQTVNTLCSDSYTLLVTWIATDDCGNTQTATQTFVVSDTTKPLITLSPASVTIRCDTFALPPAPVLGQDVVATDNCGDIASLTFADFSNQNPDPAQCGHYTYTIVRTFTVTDDCGNSRTSQQTIQVLDNIPPDFSGFSDTTFICMVPLPLTPAPAATDLCTGIASAPVLTNDIITGGPCSDSYTRTLSWSSTDLCGNTGYFSQDIIVADTIAPTLSGVPADAPAECNAIPAPPAPGVVMGSDNCDEEVDISFVETEIRDPNPANCAHWTNYMIRREWTAVDNCGNSRTYTQSIMVQDNAGPEILALDTVKTPTAPGACGANTVVPSLLSVFDDCTAQTSNLLLRDTVVLTPSGTPVDLVPVDTVVFSWSAPNMPPAVPVVGNATLAVALDMADSELLSETFEIWGEDGFHIGRTKRTLTPCGSSGDTTFSIPAALLNAWLTDGQLNIILSPNGNGPDACNAYCTGGRARASISYAVATQQVPLTVEVSIDNAPFIDYPPATSFFLDAGDHLILYKASDCAGNSSTATTIVRIEDTEPPTVIAPAPITAYTGTNDCIAVVPLPFPNLSENCGFSADINKSSAIAPVQFENDPNAGWVPKNLVLSIPGVIPNAVTGGILKISHLGDNGNTGEFFKVLDEQNAFLGATTPSITGECSVVHETIIPVSAAQINSWAADGTASISLQANRDVVNFSDFINPCGPITNGFDGTSTIQVMLMYNQAVVDYTIQQNNLTVQSGQLTGNKTTVSLTAGTYSAQYKVLDNSGNEGNSTFALTVRDTVRPVALCRLITIFTNPSGSIDYTLSPAEINNGSTDNCSGTNLSYQLSQTIFTCNMATPPNDTYPVTLTVTDTAGNSSTCTATVRVKTVTFQPTVTPGVCEGFKVQFSANPPAPNTGYTYVWNGPKNFVSFAENPEIPNATTMNEGTYVVTITGPSGCTAVGSVLLDLTKLPTQPEIFNTPSLICQGANLTLQCTAFGGNNVMYAWYSGTPASSTLIGTTTTPLFTVPTPAPGLHQFYVKVSADGCTSVPSPVKEITVQARPVATVSSKVISVCTCEPIALGTNFPPGPGISYQWNGPGFNSTAQTPSVTACAQSSNAGAYILVVFENGCPSTPDTTMVTIRAKPPKPVISGITSVCEGDTILLVCNNVPTAAQYRWIRPNAPDTFTSNNSLLIPQASLADSGSWFLQVVLNNCQSDVSDAKLVQIQAYPNVSASSNSPICQGVPLQLNGNSTTPGVTYTWKGPSGYEMIGPNPVLTMPVSGVYVVTASTPLGCTQTATASVTVVVPPAVNSVTNNAPACADCATGTVDAVLQAVIFPPNSSVTYTWTGPPLFNTSSLAMPVISSVCPKDNGTYNIFVTDAFGCKSNVGSTEINVVAQPATPQLGPDQSFCVGGAFSISVLNASDYGSNASFEWHTPNGVITQTQSKLNYPITGLQHNGDYRLVVKAGNCASDTSAAVRITVNGFPPAPIASSNSPVCQGDTLRLYASTVPGASYSWTGPAGSGFTASIKDPTVPVVGSAFAGCYFVVATVNGCASEANNVCVEIKARPGKPSILNAAPICLDQAGAVLTLTVAPGSATPGAQYIWYNNQTKLPLGPASFSLVCPVTDLSGFQAGIHSFYVRAMLDGCLSEPSDLVFVTFDEVPPGTAFAGVNFKACDELPFKLNAGIPPAGVNGLWSHLSGPAITVVNPQLPNSQVVGGIAGTTHLFVWSLTKGACVNYSQDTVEVSISKFEQPLVDPSIVISCSSDNIELSAIPGQTVSGHWTQPPAQSLQQPPVIIADPDNPNTTVSNVFPPTVYYFDWTFEIAGCSTATARVAVHTVSGQPDAGQDQHLCDSDSSTFFTAGKLDTLETGQWISLNNPGAKIANPNDPKSKVRNLQIGENIFQWETNNGLCGALSRDTVSIFFDLAPVAYSDSIVVAFGQKITLDVLQNDVKPPQYIFQILSAPSGGSLEELAPGQLSYLPKLTFSGTDELTYQLCNIIPECACATAKVKFFVSEAGECLIPSIITPNGDGANDIFVIPPQCLVGGEGESDSEVTIFNQWGDQVYHKQPYDNTWDGTYNGEPLPAGTYFYLVRLAGESQASTGFLLIQR